QRQSVRALCRHEPIAWPLWLVVLVADRDELSDTSILVVKPGAKEYCGHIPYRAVGGPWHVAGEIRHRDYQPPQGFSAIRVEHLLPHFLGLGDAARVH